MLLQATAHILLYKAVAISALKLYFLFLKQMHTQSVFSNPGSDPTIQFKLMGISSE